MAQYYVAMIVEVDDDDLTPTQVEELVYSAGEEAPYAFTITEVRANQ